MLAHIYIYITSKKKRIYHHQNVRNKTGRTSEFWKNYLSGMWKSSLWYHCPRDRLPRVEPSLREPAMSDHVLFMLQKLTSSHSATSFDKINVIRTNFKKLSAPSKKVVSKASGGHKSIVFRVRRQLGLFQNPKAQSTSPQLLHFILFILQGLDSPKATC